MLLLVVQEGRDLWWILLLNVLRIINCLLNLRYSMLAVLVLGDAGGFHFLEADGASLRVLDHCLERLGCRVLRVPRWRLAHVFVVENFFDFLDSKADHAAANLDRLRAIWLQLDVFGLGED